MQAAELGLELSGPLGQAYIIPYWNAKTRRTEAQFQIGYRGFLRLAFNSGQVSTFNAHIVRERDHFKYQYGSDPKLEHTPAAAGRGEPVAAYAVLRLKDGTTDFEVMSWEEIVNHRDRYSKAYSDPKMREYSPWQTAQEEMARKTVIRRLAKRSPLSPEIGVGVADDEHGEAVVSANLPALPEPVNRMAALDVPGDEDQPAAGPAEGEVVIATEDQQREIQGLLTLINWANKNYVADFQKRHGKAANPDDMSVEMAEAELAYLRQLCNESKAE
jgi:recombination protein RecT